MNIQLRDSLEHFKKWQRKHIKDRCDLYDIPPDADLLSDEIDHAIDHIIRDHCEDEST